MSSTSYRFEVGGFECIVISDGTFAARAREVVHPIQVGTSIITQSLEVPEEIILEESVGYYYYVYVTLPTGSWNSQVWGLAQNVDVSNESPDFVIDEFPFGSITSILSALIALAILLRRRA